MGGWLGGWVGGWVAGWVGRCAQRGLLWRFGHGEPCTRRAAVRVVVCTAARPGLRGHCWRELLDAGCVLTLPLSPPARTKRGSFGTWQRGGYPCMNPSLSPHPHSLLPFAEDGELHLNLQKMRKGEVWPAAMKGHTEVGRTLVPRFESRHPLAVSCALALLPPTRTTPPPPPSPRPPRPAPLAAGPLGPAGSTEEGHAGAVW
jgi:hypothetical protein